MRREMVRSSHSRSHCWQTSGKILLGFDAIALAVAEQP